MSICVVVLICRGFRVWLRKMVVGLISYVVLKASLFGGIKKIKKFSQYLTIHNVNLVLSSALDSPIGNMSNIHVASFLKLNNKHGLNNYMFYDYAQSSSSRCNERPAR